MPDSNFSSFPPQQEASFIVYEQRIESATRSGMMAGLIAGIGLGVFIIGIRLAVTPEKRGDYSSDSSGVQTQKAAPAPVQKPAEAPDPAAAAASASGSASGTATTP